MRKLVAIALVLALLPVGCVSKAEALKETGFCAKVKESIADDFGVYGLFLQEGNPPGDMHYCEYLIGKTRVLQLLYTEESDPERARFGSLTGIKSSAVTDSYFILSAREKTKGNVSSFYVDSMDKKSGAIKSYAAAFGHSSSITLSAIYVPGYPNPFTNGKMLEKIAIKALGISGN